MIQASFYNTKKVGEYDITKTAHYPPYPKMHYKPSLDQLWSSQHDQHWDSYNHANLKRSKFFQAHEHRLIDKETENFGNYIQKKPISCQYFMNQ